MGKLLSLKIVLFLLSLPADILAIEQDAYCINRRVVIAVEAIHVKDVENIFLPMSSLPYVFNSTPIDKKMSRMEISYRWPNAKDKFTGPDSMELGARVFAALKDHLQVWGIKKIVAEFAPDVRCNE